MDAAVAGGFAAGGALATREPAAPGAGGVGGFGAPPAPGGGAIALGGTAPGGFGAAAAAGGGGGAAAGSVGNLIVAEAVGFGGKLMRTVSFFGWTLASEGLGGTGAPGTLGVFSAINVYRTKLGLP